MRWCAWAMAGLLAGAGLACDDKNDVPPEVLKAQQNEQQRQREMAVTKPAPTTQELLTGAKKTLPLGGFPLTLDVPKDWSLQSLGEGALITVTGPASSGEIDIQLVHQAQTLSAASIEAAMAAAKKEVDAKPHPINRLEMRSVGPAKVLEQRMISNEFVGGKLPPEIWGDSEVKYERTGETRKIKSVLNPHMVKWNFTIFLPTAGDKYAVRSMNFMRLKLSEYEKDKEFLEQLMKSLKYAE